MSLRPLVHGFELSRFRSLFGSRDAAVISDVEARRAVRLAQATRAPGEAEEEMFRASLRRAVNEGAPFPELDEESHVHVQLAVALAGAGQELHDAGSDFWTWRAFVAFWKEHAASLDPRGRSLFGCFLKGRPVFGKKIASDTYYGYLNRHDVATLRDSLSKQRSEMSGDASAFVADMVGWLDAIDGRGQDLWFHFL
jgi:hypothetical protein